MTSAVTIPAQVLFILKTLTQAGHQAFIVGGAVRDLLLGQDEHLSPQIDFDFATSVKPEQILELFPESFYENEFGTVMVSFDDICQQMGVETPSPKAPSKPQIEKIIDLAKATKLHESLQAPNDQSSQNQATFPNFEITTFRSEGSYSNFRKPDTVEWGESLEEDLTRRDFTINAMALKIPDQVLQKFEETLDQVVKVEYQLIDPHQGQQDLKNKLIRTVGEPNQRFTEDALRMLRAIRFSVQLQFQIDDDTLEAIKPKAQLIEKMSSERIRDELIKMLSSSQPKKAIELLDQAALLPHILPELEVGKGVEQGGHHTTDVWTHSLDALEECPSPDPIVRLATLLHDVAKPQTQGKKNGDVTFYNHEIVGSRIAYKIAKRLKLSKRDCQRIFTLVRYHMFHYQPHNTDAAIRRFMRKVGLENIDDILDLREADRLGSGARKTSWRLEEMKQRMVGQLNQPMETRDLAIDGHQLMEELYLKPGPVIGKIQQALLEKVIDDPDLNEPQKLLEISKQLIEGQK